jgi:HNH endonuclease
MCTPGQQSAPASAADAVAMARAGLAWLADSDPTALTAAEQADCLRELERAESLHLAARASVLTAFATAGGFEDDGHGSARTWLKWQTQITGGAAANAIGWMRRLADHPAVRDALAGTTISASWSRHICDWTDLLPEAARADADVILLGAAAGGADLADLAGLAEEMRKRTARPDTDHGDGFDDRWLRIGLTFRGTGRLDAGLTPQCAAAVTAVLAAHLRRAVIIRDRHCRFPGCDQPAAACQPHHIIPRAAGGPHRLTNLLLLCSFHHLIAVHRWDWTITLHPDATVTATSPDRTQIFHSHSPPANAA